MGVDDGVEKMKEGLPKEDCDYCGKLQLCIDISIEHVGYGSHAFWLCLDCVDELDTLTRQRIYSRDFHQINMKKRIERSKEKL